MSKKIYRYSLVLGLVLFIILSYVLSLLFYDFYRDVKLEELENIRALYNLSEPGPSLKNIDIREVKNQPEPGEVYLDLGGSYLVFKQDLLGFSSIFLPCLTISMIILAFFSFLLPLFAKNLVRDLTDPIRVATDAMEDILDDKSVDFDLVYPELHPFISNLNLYKEKAKYYTTRLQKNEAFRRNFTANVSHELKTPLTSINGYAELLQEGLVKPEDTRSIGAVIYKEGRRLLGLIDSIIELSNLDDPNLNLEMEDLSLRKFTELIVSNLENQINSNDLNLSLEGDRGIIRGNPRMIQDLLYNLIDNAIKYNRPGGLISIKISSLDGFVVYSISDTGQGIDQKDINRVFERFYRADRSRSSKTKGSGLGLSIVKHIVDLHSGKIDLKSEPGRGTVFTIEFKK